MIKQNLTLQLKKVVFAPSVSQNKFAYIKYLNCVELNKQLFTYTFMFFKEGCVDNEFCSARTGADCYKKETRDNCCATCSKFETGFMCKYLHPLSLTYFHWLCVLISLLTSFYLY